MIILLDHREPRRTEVGTMADRDQSTCPRCGGGMSSGAPPGICPRFLLSDAERGQSEDSAVAMSPAERAHLERRLLLAWAAAGMGTILFAGIWFAKSQGQPRSDAAFHYRRGANLQVHGRLKEAVAEYRAAIRLVPNFAQAHFKLGLALLTQGKPEEALTELRAATRLEPGFAEAHHNLGIALANQGNPEDAIAEYRAAIVIEPGNANAHCNLGIALGAQGKLDEAIAELRHAIRLEPFVAEAHYNLGVALRRQGKPAEAIAEFRKAYDSAKPGSEFAQLIERAVSESER